MDTLTVDHTIANTVGTATLAHVMPGRIRLRVQSVRGDAERAAEIEQLLSALEFVDHVTANPGTGSVVIEYSPDLTGTVDLLGTVASALDVEIEEPRHARRVTTQTRADADPADNVREIFRETNTRVAEATGGADLRLIVPGALFCLGVGAFLGAKRRRMPAWHELIWYAYNTFEMLNQPEKGAADLTQE